MFDVSLPLVCVWPSVDLTIQRLVQILQGESKRIMKLVHLNFL